MEQSHESLAYAIWSMARAIRSKYKAGKAMSDEDRARVQSLEKIANDHARAAQFQDRFTR